MLAFLFGMTLMGFLCASVWAREKNRSSDPNDPTIRLFELLDNSYEGKLPDFYLLGDTLKNASSPDEELQHVLRLQYDKNRTFGRMTLHVRTLKKMEPEQLKTYTAKQIYEFGEEDSEKFVKSDAGPLGKTGDMYLRANGDRPLASAPITDEARKTYEQLLTQYLIPALQKK